MNPEIAKIVVADDDEINLEILMRSLSRNGGYKSVEGFTDGDVTWEYLEENPDAVDLVVLDKMMPRMGGMEVIAKMMEHPILKNIPVVFQTGEADEPQVQECLDAGAFACLTKPFDEGDFLHKCHSALRKREVLMNNDENK